MSRQEDPSHNRNNNTHYHNLHKSFDNDNDYQINKF